VAKQIPALPSRVLVIMHINKDIATRARAALFICEDALSRALRVNHLGKSLSPRSQSPMGTFL